MSRPSIRAVIVNWKRADLTARAASSLAPQLREGDRLVIVDNASHDGSVEQLRSEGWDVVENEVNGGFGYGVNAGTQGFTEDVLVLLNNDAVAEEGFLDALVAPLASGVSGDEGPQGAHPVGATTALILLMGRWVMGRAQASGLCGPDGQTWVRTRDEDPSGQTLINSTGNCVDASGNGYDRDWLTPLGDLNENPEVFGFCGGACAISREAWESCGLFREDLFMYYEDTDYSWRLRERGWVTRFVPEARVHHEHAASSDAHSDMFVRVNTRNRILVAATHAPYAVIARALARTAMRAGRNGMRGPVADGFKQALVALPGSIRARHRAGSPGRISR